MGLADDASLDDLRFVWYHRVVPLLQEYFYNDGERLHAVLGDGFVKRTQVSQSAASALVDVYDPEAPKYEIVELAGDELVAALQKHGERVFGEPIPAIGVPLYTDARLYGEAGIPVVLYGAGPRTVPESNAKRADENLLLEDLRKALGW